MIHKYVKLPVEIEAVQFTRDNFEEIKSFTNGIAKSFTIERCPNGKCWCIIPTLEGVIIWLWKEIILLKGCMENFIFVNLIFL